MIRTLFGAIQFLTIVPVRFATATPGRSAAWFPLIGALIGLAGMVVYDVGRFYFHVSLACALVIAFWIFIGGGFHEDALADVADAVRRDRRPERILEILKDSRIGAHGGLALMLSLLLRWQSLSGIAVIDYAPVFALAQAAPRGAMVVLAWLTPPAGSGLGAAFVHELSSAGAVVAMVQVVLLAFLCGWKAAVFLLAGIALILITARRYFVARIGGVTGDCLGAVAQIVEIFVLVAFACRSCVA